MDQAPDDGRPEFGFIGRSNVGKSSLINMLCGRRELAHTSGKPGKTQLLNYFLINESWYLTDLPGYGYASQSKKTRAKWQRRTYDYFEHRRTLVSGMVLIDAGISPQQKDLDFVNWLGEHGVPFALVFTKVDRRKARDGAHIAAFRERMAEHWEELPPIFSTSALTGAGREDIFAYIQESLARIPWPFGGEDAAP